MVPWLKLVGAPRPPPVRAASVAKGLDGSSDFGAEHGDLGLGQPEQQAIDEGLAADEAPIPIVDGCGTYFDENLAVLGRGFGQLPDLKSARWSVPGENDRFHLVVAPVGQELTTQQAADLLIISGRCFAVPETPSGAH